MGLLISLLILIFVAWLLFYLTGFIPEPGATIARVIIAIILILKLLSHV